MRTIQIGEHTVGEGQPCYIIAEMSGNHGGDIERAKEIIRQAKQAGADAVKIQVYRPDTITIDCDKADFRIADESAWSSYQTLYQLYAYAYTPWEWVPELIREAEQCEIQIFGSVFDHTSVELMEQYDTPVWKIASAEIVDVPLLQKVAATGKPVILSTGLASVEDIALAINTLRNHGCEQIALLKCTTAYPAPVEESNLRTIPNLSETFDVVSGLSDHTTGIAVPVASVALGGSVIEKHFTIDREKTVDSFFSLTPDEFKLMVNGVRVAEQALGAVQYGVTESAKLNIGARRSLYVSQPIRKGERITAENARSVRPGYGMHPKHYDKVLGMVAACDLEPGEPLEWNKIKEKGD